MKPQLELYGSALNPVASIAAPCPLCGGRLIADLCTPADEKLQLAEATMTPAMVALWLSLCEVSCIACGWIGSAIRPEEAIAA